MTRTQAIGVALIALGLAYALLYAAWLRRRTRHRAAGDAVVSSDERTTRDPSVEIVSAMGTYTGTSEQDGAPVTTAGLGVRGPGTLLVTRGDPDHLVTIERRGQDSVLITSDQLVNARRGQDRGRLSRGGAPIVLTWRAVDGLVCTTSFVPRFAADLDRVESALWWHESGSDVRTTTTDHDPDHSPTAPTEESANP